jgi:hypothetical protein
MAKMIGADIQRLDSQVAGRAGRAPGAGDDAELLHQDQPIQLLPMLPDPPSASPKMLMPPMQLLASGRYAHQLSPVRAFVAAGYRNSPQDQRQRRNRCRAHAPGRTT